MVDRLSKGCPRLRDYEEKEYIELSEGDPRLSSDDDDDDTIVQVEKNFCLVCQWGLPNKPMLVTNK
jgi:hypothetical protein